MLFSSTIFIYLFLPVVLVIYYGFLRKNRKLQNYFLTLASLFFYAWGEPKFVLVMMLSILVNWLMGLMVAHHKSKKNLVMEKVAVTITVVVNLSILFVFKYLTFTANIIQQVLGFSMSIPQIALPIGISFFTFQAMSYVLDVYRGKGLVQRNILNVALYISLFPQLIAGPIVRYETIAEEIENRKETWDDFLDGFTRFILGLCKKVLISNSLSVFADNAFFSLDTVSVAGSWLGALCYTFQIFFDFSGYSDMAIGLGKMFGFHFLENFDYPYISRSITEFWRRWHISLGSFFRDYVYFPLGGSRVNKPCLIRNLFVVWFLTGIWHGANWTFLLWGIMYFVLLTVEKLTNFPRTQPGKIGSVARWAYTMFFVVLGWVIFRADSLSDAFSYMATMFAVNRHPFADTAFLTDLRHCLVPLCFAVIFSMPVGKWLRSKIRKDNPVLNIAYALVIVLLFILAVSSIVSSGHNPFIYFNF
ncbi:MAG: MBOAT family protein [Clostridia bacterium]|nr:MBOAT family protein [Clostridia bacterium]